ncbi:MAG TPA: molybdopterin-binding/glycosyltransferase family 2 protein [Stellaceae bacterium]|nr:molybdopterin-binding/glycosyltransferase family 2 protein [Stellaceae bacterium]
MKFGNLPLDQARGAVLAHRARLGDGTLKKGHVLTEADLARLAEAGWTHVIAARLDAEDVAEDQAAETAAAACIGDNVTAGSPFTGRVNLFGACRGLAVIDRAQIDRLNLIDEALTIATVPPYAVVEPKQMLATIKVIPFAVPCPVLETWVAGATDAVRVAPFVAQRIGLIQTRLEGLKESVLDRTAKITEARVTDLGSSLLGERRVAHEAADVAAAIGALLAEGADLILASGASAIVDRDDVIPAAIVARGGSITHFGMPVDPGNLLLIGRIGKVTVLGLPGCARSPKLNGFDWILQRLAARLPVGREDIMRLGAGGLLAEIPTRPQPRAGEQAVAPLIRDRPSHAPRIAAIVLAAGQSRRMGERNKLLIEVAGKSMVAHAVDAARGAGVSQIIVVTGHEPGDVAAALAGRPVRLVHNPRFAEGMAGSIGAGIGALGDDIDAAIIMLGDMPRVAAAELGRLIAAYNPVEGRAIIVPTRHGRRGNPVLWDRSCFAELGRLRGDVGARGLIDAHADWLAEIEMVDDHVLLDIDTPEALAAFTGNRPMPPG